MTLRKSKFLSALDLGNAISEGVNKDHLLKRTIQEDQSFSESESDDDSKEAKAEKDAMVERMMRRSASPTVFKRSLSISPVPGSPSMSPLPTTKAEAEELAEQALKRQR
jgi:hypothetical protein